VKYNQHCVESAIKSQSANKPVAYMAMHL